MDRDRLIRIPCVLCCMRIGLYWERPRLSVYMYEKICASLEPDDCRHAPTTLRAFRIDIHLITENVSILPNFLTKNVKVCRFITLWVITLSFRKKKKENEDGTAILHAIQQDSGCQIFVSSTDLVSPVNSGREFLTSAQLYPDKRIYSGWLIIEILFVLPSLTRHASLHSFFR
jgi:hypothetical protein